MAELGLYDVTVRSGYKTQMKLTEDEAELLGGEKVADVKTAEPQPVSRPPYAVDADADEKPAEKRAAPARNKARSGDDK